MRCTASITVFKIDDLRDKYLKTRQAYVHKYLYSHAVPPHKNSSQQLCRCSKISERFTRMTVRRCFVRQVVLAQSEWNCKIAWLRRFCSLNILRRLCTMQTFTSTVVPLYYAPPRQQPPGLCGHIFTALVFSKTKYLSPAATPLTRQRPGSQPVGCRKLQFLITSHKLRTAGVHTLRSRE